MWTKSQNEVAKLPILIVNAGGTISQSRDDNGEYTNIPNTFVDILEASVPSKSFHYEYVELPGGLIDSSEASPRDWMRLALFLVANYIDYSGFVILHGTDTMAYTAAALSYMLKYFDRGVVLTGAQKSLYLEPKEG